MRWMLWLSVIVTMASAGCATSFTGDAHFPGGVSGCRKHCDASGLAMESFVYMGEYSSACVCAAPSGAPKYEGASASAAGASAGAAVGVVMAMREREREERQRQQQHNAGSVPLF